MTYRRVYLLSTVPCQEYKLGAVYNRLIRGHAVQGGYLENKRPLVQTNQYQIVRKTSLKQVIDAYV